MTSVVLLTGATGFVGRQVLRSLGDRDALVRVVVREGKQRQLKALDFIEKIVTTTDLFAEAWCRLFYLHGEGEDARRLVPYLRAKLIAGEPAELTSGKQIRDYLDVRDAGR